MNRKTASILCAAGGLAAAAVVLGAHPRTAGSSNHKPDPVLTKGDPPPPPVADLCNGGGAPARATTEFGPGNMTAALSDTHVLRGGDGEMYLSVDLTARDAEGTDRPPLNVAIVIDHSGSMAGDKIEKAREAARGLVTRLHANDHVSLVQYDDVAQVLVHSTAMDEGGKRRLLVAIDTIRDGGGTNLNDGLLLGRDEVLRDLAEGHVNRVILLSDGNANVGVTDIPSLAKASSNAAERGVRITTIGLGLDYNEDLMEAVAENGRGQYYYVKDAAGLDKVFAGELRAIQGTVATAAELRLEPACNGVEIAEVYGYQTRRDGNATIVPLSDLAGGDHRKIVARLKVPVEKQGHQGVVLAGLSYADVHGGPRRTAMATLGVEVTQETALIEKNVNKDVVSKATEAESAHSLRQAAEAYEHGDQDRAVRMIGEARGKAAATAKKYALDDAMMAPTMNELSTTGAGMAATPASSPMAPAVTKGAKSDAIMMAH